VPSILATRCTWSSSWLAERHQGHGPTHTATPVVTLPVSPLTTQPAARPVEVRLARPLPLRSLIVFLRWSFSWFLLHIHASRSQSKGRRDTMRTCRGVSGSTFSLRDWRRVSTSPPTLMPERTISTGGSCRSLPAFSKCLTRRPHSPTPDSKCTRCRRARERIRPWPGPDQVRTCGPIHRAARSR